MWNMTRTRRLSTTAVLTVCLFGTPLSGTLFASEAESLAESQLPLSPRVVAPLSFVQQSGVDPTTPLARPSFNFTPTFTVAKSDTAELRSQIYQGRPIYYHDNNASLAAMLIGAAAAITGTALLIYANRPECETRPYAGGCGYGTKVIGGSVLSGGLVGVAVGALTWR
jgi:hypothetical protein